MLLKDTIGGTAKTLFFFCYLSPIKQRPLIRSCRSRMFVNVTAASDSAPETKSSLGYGASAKKIQNSVEKQFEDKTVRSLQAAKAIQREKIASLVQILKLVSSILRVFHHTILTVNDVPRITFLLIFVSMKTFWIGKALKAWMRVGLVVMEMLMNGQLQTTM